MFKKGDIVECVNDISHWTNLPLESIKKEKHYTCMADQTFNSLNEGMITIINDCNFLETFYEKRFVLILNSDLISKNIDYLKITREVCGG